MLQGKIARAALVASNHLYLAHNPRAQAASRGRLHYADCILRQKDCMFPWDSSIDPAASPVNARRLQGSLDGPLQDWCNVRGHGDSCI